MEIQAQMTEALTTASVTWRGQELHRRCGWCKRRMRHGDMTNATYGEPEPDLWPTTDGICRDCRAALH